jgi:hypothetical protein
MARQVWKFGPIGITFTEVEIPYGFKFGRFSFQRSDFYFWAEVDTKALAVKRQFIVLPTGVDVPLDCVYMDTVTDELSQTVWHLYMKV